MEWWLNLQQWAVLSIFTTLSTWAEWKVIDSEIYYYFSAKKIIEEIPMITDKKDTILKIVKTLKDKKLIEHIIHKNKWYYRISPLWKTYISDKNNNLSGIENNPHKYRNKSIPSVEINPHNNNTSNNTTQDNNSKELEQSSENYWDTEINQVLQILHKAVWIDQFKENQQRQRIYGKHLVGFIKKHSKEEFIKRLKWILENDFKASNCNSIKYLYWEIKSFIHSPIIETNNLHNKNSIWVLE